MLLIITKCAMLWIFPTLCLSKKVLSIRFFKGWKRKIFKSKNDGKEPELKRVMRRGWEVGVEMRDIEGNKGPSQLPKAWTHWVSPAFSTSAVITFCVR